MNPESVKRREYTGLVLIAGGLALCAYGLLGLVADWQPAFSAIVAGAAAAAGGTRVLTAIPTLIDELEEAEP